MEKNEFQNHILIFFLFSNFLGATILNNCDVSWLLYGSDTKSFCLITTEQPFHAQLLKMAVPGTLKRALLVKTSNIFDS